MRNWNAVELPKKNKFGNRRTTIDGITFASKREAERWCDLRLMEKAGVIADLERQVPLELVPKTDKHRARYYVADFVYTDCATGEKVYEDSKGAITQIYSLKKSIVYWRYGIDIREV